ncbi:MAG TPA: DUF1707 domain-containing protein [Jatrophihabitans sp.]|nr:DUF1707 domain-containing protein [Jatrophihabitans sp.]
MTESSATRVGDTERNAAQQALQEHLAAGRLDLDEFGDRSARAARARTAAELAELFQDLPQPHGAPAAPPPRLRRRAGEPMLGRAGETAAGLAPFVAIGLFFLVHSWLVFLLVPIVGVLVYGDRGHRPRRR